MLTRPVLLWISVGEKKTSAAKSPPSPTRLRQNDPINLAAGARPPWTLPGHPLDPPPTPPGPSETEEEEVSG